MSDTASIARAERGGPPTRAGIILGAYFTGRERVAWQHPDTGDLIDIATIVENAQIADRAGFHLHFLAEGLSLREERGGVAWHSVNGRHDVAALHAILAGATEQIGLMSTISSSFFEPFDLARKLMTIDVLSGGRAGWNVVTAQPPTSAANFGHRAALPYEERYGRAHDAIDAVRHLWTAAADGHVETPSRFDGTFTRLDVRTAWPARPQTEGPVLFTASSSDAGADFAAARADGVFILPQDFDDAVRLSARLRARLAAHGRHRDELRVLSGRDIVIGDTDEDARERFEHYVDLELTDEDVRLELEQLWQADLSDLDPHGSLPADDPDLERLQRHLDTAPGVSIRDARAHLAHWRGLAAREGLTNRELVKRAILRPAFVGSPGTVADEIERWWRAGAVDGFIVQPHVVPSGLREFADRVVPILRERGVFRSEAPRQLFRDSLRHP